MLAWTLLRKILQRNCLNQPEIIHTPFNFQVFLNFSEFGRFFEISGLLLQRESFFCRFVIGRCVLLHFSFSHIKSEANNIFWRFFVKQHFLNHTVLNFSTWTSPLMWKLTVYIFHFCKVFILSEKDTFCKISVCYTNPIPFMTQEN